MTSTLTRPRETSSSEGGAATTRGTPEAGTWLTTGDHKRLGLLFIYGGVAALLAACISGLLFFVLAGSANVWTASGSRLTSVTTSAALLIGLPALWIGMATYVMPLQIGATRLALPRLHNLALWTFAVGGALATTGYLADDRPINSLASSVPDVVRGDGPAEAVTQLIVVGLFLVALGILLSALSLVTTVLNRRADGLRLPYMPLFSWSVLATASTLVLSTPVLLAGLALLYFDHRYASSLFDGGIAGERIWEHQLWLVGQPFGLLFVAAAVGIFGDVVATHAGRPLVGFATARAATMAAPMLTLLLWAGDVSVLRSPFAPVATLGGLLVFVPLVLALTTWLGTLRSGKPRAHPSLVFLALFVVLLAVAGLFSIVAVFVDVEASRAEAFRNGQISILTFGAALIGLGAAATHWSPKLWGRMAQAGPAGAQALLLFLGALALALPGYLVGLGAGEAVTAIGVAGCGLTFGGLALFLRNLSPAKAEVGSDPYKGHTLEWATTSPPPLHNFDRLPDIRSAHPLTDERGEA